MQQTPEAYVTCEVPVHSVYATEVTTFATSEAIKEPHEVDQYAGLGKDTQSNEEGSIAANSKVSTGHLEICKLAEGLKS